MTDEVDGDLGAVDISIFVVYLVFITAIGVYYQKKASENISSFFLGGRNIPWWMMGFSGMASNLDVSGTMINCAMVYVFGMGNGFFVELRGGVTPALSFLLVFQGKWARRCRCFTVAEWMTFRFGDNRQGHAARCAVAVLNLLSSVFQITYFAVGSGKFAAEFLGISSLWGIPEEFFAALIMVVLSLIYTLSSGLHGVVITDVAQAAFIFAIVVYACVRSFATVSLPDRFQVSFPLSDPDPITGSDFSSWNVTRSEWLSFSPRWSLDYPSTSAYSSLNNFGVAMIFYSLRALTEGLGGGNGYMMQRYFALGNDVDVIRMTLLWIFLLSFRWAFISALTLLGVQYGIDQGAPIEDPERVLPVTVSNSFPVVAKGLALAGFTAAAMSTFDSVVNAGAAYWVKDIYQMYIHPAATEAHLMWHSRAACLAIVLAGLFFSLVLSDVNSAWSFLQFSIFGANCVPYMMRWYWEGCTGYGFTAGIVVGLITSLILFFAVDMDDFYKFAVNIVVGFVTVVLVSLNTPAVDADVLQHFYKTTRPPGLWKHTRAHFSPELVADIAAENNNDAVGVVFALASQLSLFLVWMSLVASTWDQFAIILLIFIVSISAFYFFWLRHAFARALSSDALEKYLSLYIYIFFISLHTFFFIFYSHTNTHTPTKRSNQYEEKRESETYPLLN